MDIIEQKHGNSLTLEQFIACLKEFKEHYQTGLSEHIARLQAVTQRVQSDYLYPLIRIGLNEGEKVVFIGDIHQRTENLKKILAHYEKGLKAKTVKLVFLGDFIHSAYGNLYSATQSLETIDVLTPAMQEFPDGIIALPGNHDKVNRWGNVITKEEVPVGGIFIQTALYLRGNEYLTSLHDFFESLPLAAVIEMNGGERIFAAHSFTDSPANAKGLAEAVNLLIRQDKPSVPLPDAISAYIGQDGKINMKSLLWGREFLEPNSPLIPEFHHSIPGLKLLVFGHTFSKEQEHPECYKFYEENGREGFVLQSFMDNPRLVEVSANGQVDFFRVP